jgi:RTX calcium-binding nonapeptide repeat (4 copies)
MKKLLLILLICCAAAAGPDARAEGGPLTMLLAGGPEDNVIRISLTADGRAYVITSADPLEAGGDICWHPEERRNELLCKAPAIAGFEVNVDGGDDSVALGSDISIPATLRGGPGRDRLIGGGVADKIIGGPGADYLSGRRGDDLILGGSGPDKLVGGPGNDQLRGGPDTDLVLGGSGHDDEVQ